MTIGQLTADRLKERVARFPDCRIAVLGDYFLDKYLDVDRSLEEVSVETGRPAHQVVGVRCHPGAAGTVVSNLIALGARHVHAIGFRGEDGEGYDLERQMRQLGCCCEHFHVVTGLSTPTYLKPRDTGTVGLAAEHPRYDTKNRQPHPSIESRILRSLEEVLPTVDAVIVLDQVEQPECGAITANVRGALARCARQSPKTVFWADSRRRIHAFEGLIIKPNQFEAVGFVDPKPGDEVDLEALRELAAASWRNRAPVVVTLGARGMLVSDPQPTLVPGVELSGPLDPTGAGDSATAATVLAVCRRSTVARSGTLRQPGGLTDRAAIGDDGRCSTRSTRPTMGTLATAARWSLNRDAPRPCSRRRMSRASRSLNVSLTRVGFEGQSISPTGIDKEFRSATHPTSVTAPSRCQSKAPVQKYPLRCSA